MDYKSRLISLNLLPLMMTYESNDLAFFLKCLQSPSEAFNIFNFVNFCSSSTRSSGLKLKHHYCNNNTSHHFFFNCLPRLWNRLPPLDYSLPLSALIPFLKSFFWSHFDSSNPCTFHLMCPCSKCLTFHSTPNFKPCTLSISPSLSQWYSVIYLAD